MKTTVSAKELRELNACSSGYETFVNAHGEESVGFSKALESNGWDDIWWLIDRVYLDLSEQQQKDLHLLGCDWAESCLNNFEKHFPDDKRPRKAIEAKRLFVNGEIAEKELKAARLAAESAARSARSAAWSAAWSARSAAWSAARSAAESAAWSARSAESAMTKDLMVLFKKWEGEQVAN